MEKLYSVIHQNTLNDIIVKTIQIHHPSVGEYVGEESESEVAKQLSPELITGMNEVTNEIIETVKSLNEIFISKNITAISPEAYLKFLCDLLPKYLMAPTSEVTKEEAEASMILQVENTTIEEMREALANRNYQLQAEPILTYELIAAQINEIDNGTIKEAFKTLLLTQLNQQTQQ